MHYQQERTKKDAATDAGQTCNRTECDPYRHCDPNWNDSSFLFVANSKEQSRGAVKDYQSDQYLEKKHRQLQRLIAPRIANEERCRS